METVRIESESRTQAAVNVMKAAMYFMLAFALFSLGFLALQTREVEIGAVKHFDTVLDQGSALIGTANETIPTIALDIHGVTSDAHTLIGTANAGLNRFFVAMPPLIASVQESADNLKVTTKDSYKIANDARLTIDNFNSVALDGRFYYETQVPQLFDGISTTVKTLDARLADLQPIEANAAEITGSGATIAHDAVVEEQKYVYPAKSPWWKKTFGYVNMGARIAICAAAKATCTL